MIRCAVAQFAATTDKQKNLTEIARYVRQAAIAGATLVVFPENAMYNNPDKEVDIRSETEPVDGPFATRIAQLAKRYDIAIVAGMTETSPADSDRSVNTVIAVDRDGGSLGVYRKVHLYDAFGYRESDRIEPQQPSALTFTMNGITFGVMTCYDIRFPEMARFLVDAGADALIIPAAWVVGPMKEFHWTTLATARAIENTSYVLACGQTGPDSVGQSTIIDPMGVTLACAGEEPSTVFADLDPERLKSVRAKNPSLANRRFDSPTMSA